MVNEKRVFFQKKKSGESSKNGAEGQDFQKKRREWKGRIFKRKGELEKEDLFNKNGVGRRRGRVPKKKEARISKRKDGWQFLFFFLKKKTRGEGKREGQRQRGEVLLLGKKEERYRGSSLSVFRLLFPSRLPLYSFLSHPHTQTHAHVSFPKTIFLLEKSSTKKMMTTLPFLEPLPAP